MLRECCRAELSIAEPQCTPKGSGHKQKSHTEAAKDTRPAVEAALSEEELTNALDALLDRELNPGALREAEALLSHVASMALPSIPLKVAAMALQQRCDEVPKPEPARESAEVQGQEPAPETEAAEAEAAQQHNEEQQGEEEEEVDDDDDDDDDEEDAAREFCRVMCAVPPQVFVRDRMISARHWPHKMGYLYRAGTRRWCVVIDSVFYE